MKISTVIIDDEHTSVELLKQLLLKTPHVAVVGTADSVDTGVNLIDQTRPDLVFLDINMPEMNGWECLSMLKSNPLTKNIPVLIYSTSSHPRDRQIAAELGASGFITKPSDYKTLHRTLSAIASGLYSDIKKYHV